MSVNVSNQEMGVSEMSIVKSYVPFGVINGMSSHIRMYFERENGKNVCGSYVTKRRIIKIILNDEIIYKQNNPVTYKKIKNHNNSAINIEFEQEEALMRYAYFFIPKKMSSLVLNDNLIYDYNDDGTVDEIDVKIFGHPIYYNNPDEINFENDTCIKKEKS